MVFHSLQALHSIARSCCKPNGGCSGIWSILSKASVPDEAALEICRSSEVLCDTSGNVREVVIKAQPFKCPASALQPLAGLSKLEQFNLLSSNITGLSHLLILFPNFLFRLRLNLLFFLSDHYR
jgi:hypothetical protein